MQVQAANVHTKVILATGQVENCDASNTHAHTPAWSMVRDRTQINEGSEETVWMERKYPSRTLRLGIRGMRRDQDARHPPG
jgi:hypothetical protein